MALNTGKILMRRGQEANFDPNKMMPGEWAVSLDSKFVRMCFSPGVCVRMATYEAFEADMEQIREILAECQTVEEAIQRIYEDIKDVAVDVERIEAAAASALESEENALNSANSASQSANTAAQKASDAAGSANIASTKAEQATEGANTATQKASEAAESADNVRNMSDVSQSYAVGGTGTREGEDADNAKYYNQQASGNADRAEAAAERASAVADVGVATTEKAGLVKPDGETIRVDPDGTIHADRGTTNYTDLENKPTINDVELDGNKTLDELGIASKEALEETDNKVNIIIENAELRFKETASGENIHLDDSADSKLVEFALFGKATQKTTSGKNLISYPHTETTHEESGVTFTDNNDGTVTVNGMSTHEDGSIYNVISPWSPTLIIELQPNTSYILSGCPSGGGSSKYYLQYRLGNSDLSSSIWGADFGEGVKIDTNDTNCYIGVRIVIRKGIPTENLVFKPMLRLASITDDTWEPYTGGIPSPNPDYRQEIAVAGESYNLLPYPYSETTHTQAGITWTDNGDGTVTANGTQTGGYSDFFLISTDKPMILKAGTYIFNGCLSGGVLDKTYFMLIGSIIDGVTTRLANDVGNGATFTINKDTPIWALIRYSETAVATNHVFKPMLRKASVKNDRYMSYGKGSVEVKSVGKNLTPYPYYRESGFASSGITYIYDEKGVITANGISNGVSFFVLANALKEDFPKLVGKTTLSLKSNSGLFSVYIKYEDINGNMIIEYAVRNKNGSITFDAYDGEYHQIEMGLYLPENTSVTSDKIYVQLESGEASTEYEPYKETASLIQTENGLAGIPVDSGGNYTDQNGQQWICDEIVKYADGSGEKVQRIEKSVFDGSTDEGWVASNTNDTAKKRMQTRSLRNYIKKVESSVIFNGMSNIALANSSNNTWRCVAGVSTDTAGDIFVYSENYNTDDVSLWTSYLVENPMTLYYELAQPIKTPLTAEQLAEIEKLKTFYKVTNISNDADCGMKVKYIADAKSYIDNRLNLIEQAILNSI